MGDSKSLYSEKSKEYVSKTVKTNELDRERATKSIARNAKYGKNWDKNKVNINEVVDKFTPGAMGKTVSGVKFVYKNKNYIVEADKVSGYLRIYNRKLKKYVQSNGQPGTRDNTHYRIKKRSEM